MLKDIILLGYFIEAVELCEKAGYRICGIISNEGMGKCQYPYLGNDKYVIAHKAEFNSIPLFMVPDAPDIREKLYYIYHENGFRFETVISPNATISSSASVGEGCMVQDSCNISSNVILGKCVRVNSCANIMHDTLVGDFTTIAPNAVILGRCILEDKSYIGANATILPEKKVGAGSTVGAGAVVTKNVDKKVTVVGIPADVLKKEKNDCIRD